jgi:hypothetical protein
LLFQHMFFNYLSLFHLLYILKKNYPYSSHTKKQSILWSFFLMQLNEIMCSYGYLFIVELNCICQIFITI